MIKLPLPPLPEDAKRMFVTSAAMPPEEKSVSAPRYQDKVPQLLKVIPSDDYGRWFEVGCALKHLGYSFDVFRDWSATCPEKFDEDDCRKKWGELPDDPRAGLPTLRKWAEEGGIFTPAPEQMLEPPVTKKDQIRQGAEYLLSRFAGGKSVERCTDLRNRSLNNAIDMSGINSCDELVTILSDLDGHGCYPALVGANCFNSALATPDDKAPTNAMVDDCRFVLLESDEEPIDEQWKKITAMRLPVASIVFSGNRSLHVVCRVDAGSDMQLFKSRVEMLYNYAESKGLKVDRKCGNPSRLTRLPGGMNNGKLQHVVSWAWGYSSWKDFEARELPAPDGADAENDGDTVVLDPEVVSIEKEYGQLIYFSSNGKKVEFNQFACAAYITSKTQIYYLNGDWYKYDPETGLWGKIYEAELLNHICKTLIDIGCSKGLDFPAPSSHFCRGIKAFMMTRPWEDNGVQTPYIHVANGVLEITEGNAVLKPFSPNYHSFNRTEIDYDPSATCPRFLVEVMERALPSEDIEVIQRYSGQCLLGDNRTQTFLLLTGNAGSGKGLIANIIQKVIGINSCVELRTGHLGNRFESARFIGKTLLYGPDVPPDFLRQKAAAAIKSLCGGDLLSGEIKGVQAPVSLSGHFNILATANDTLMLGVNCDVDAWRRRLRWVCFDRPPVEKRIPDFDEILLQEEGPGILNWMIQGAAKVLQDGIPVHAEMETRIDDLLKESNSVYGFVSERLERVAGGEVAITSENLFDRYKSWCYCHSWPECSKRDFQSLAKQLIQSLYGITQSHDISGGLRGYRGLREKTTFF